jgi:hypothetical protein
MFCKVNTIDLYSFRYVILLNLGRQVKNKQFDRTHVPAPLFAIKAVLVHAMKAYRGREVYLYSFSTLALDGGQYSTSRPGHFTSGERAHDAHQIGGLVDFGTGVNALENINSLDPAGR